MRVLSTTAVALGLLLAPAPAAAGDSAFVDSVWRNQEGLPQATVSAIAETQEGYVWAGTDGGLARFDGQHFEVFDVRPATGCQAIHSLAVDAKGRLVVGTPCGVLFAEHGRLLPGAIGVPDRRSHPLTAVAVDDQGAIWVGTSAGVGRVHDRRIDMLAAPLTGAPNVAALFPAKGGGVWVADRGGLGRVDAAGRYEVVAPTTGKVRTVVEMRDGTVWAGLSTGLQRLDHGAFVADPRADSLADKEVLSLHEGPDGTLYIGLQAGGGIYALDAAGARSLWRSARDGILTIHLDRAGGILFGTPADGLHRLDQPTFRVVQQAGATDEPVWTAVAGAGGDIWIGSRAGLLHVPEGAEARVVAFVSAVRTDVLSVLRTHDGIVWAGMRDRLVRVAADGVETRTFGRQDGLPDALIGGMLEDRKGRVWVGTGWGLTLQEGDRFVPHAPLGTRVRALLEGDGDEVWVACDDGLHLLRDGKHVLALGPHEGMPEASAFSLARTRIGILVGSSAGAALVRDGKVVGTIHKQEGLVGDELLGILADGLGQVWFTTDFGIFSVREDELADYFEGRTTLVHPRSFGVGDGLPVLECNGGTSSSPIARLRSGEIAVPTMRGLVRFDPAKVKPPPAPARAVIQGIRLPYGKLQAELPRALEPSERNLRFEYTAVSLASPSRVRFVHQLEGFDPRPSEPRVERAASYTNLPPGSYRFRVRGCDVEGVCEPEGVTAVIDVAPRLFERRGFWPAVVALAVAAAAITYIRRTRQLRARTRELGERVAERTTELAQANKDLETAFRSAAAAQAAVAALLAEIPLPILVYREGKLRYVNTAACTLLASSSEELVGTATGADWRAGREVLVTTAQGKSILAEVLRSPFAWAGEPADLVIVRDVTEQRQLELRAATSERLAALGTLAAGVAHEINNPLAYVTANVEHVQSVIAKNGVISSDTREALAEAAEGAKRIAVIVKGLTTVARAGDDVVAAVDLRGVVDSALNIATAELRHRARVLVIDVDGLPPVRGDVTRLGQVVLNLLTNAAHSFRDGPIDANLITVTGSVAPDGVVSLAVADNGCGIPRDVLPKIFDPFFTTKPVGEGTGLGLSVCHGIVRALGGDITARSEVGVGTTMTVTFQPWVGPAARPASIRADAKGGKAKVLVIDDDPMVARAIGRTLLAHDVTLAPSAAAALEHIRSGTRFDLVLCDLMMPGMDGVGFYGTLERERATLLPHVVFMTGGVFSTDVARFIEKSSVVCLQKPVSTDAILRLVQAHRSAPATA